MKLLHTSDWHLGASEQNLSLEEDQRFFIDEICRIVKEKQIDAVIIAGDVYDRSVASADATRLYNDAMTKLCVDCGTTVFSIAGNHDSAERLSNCNKLLEKSGLFICGELTSDINPIDFGDTQIFMLPWITEEKVKSVYFEEKDTVKSLTDAYKLVTDKMKELFDDSKKHILISHSFITNSETSTSDRSAVIGFATQVPSSVFEGFDYVALGHIHKPQNVTDNIRYSGTPMPFSFGKEEKQEKSVTIIDTETMEKEIVPLKLLHLRTTLTGTMEELLNPNCSDDEKDGYVRLQITDSYVGLSSITELRKVYKNLIEVSGKNYEADDTTITVTMEEFERMENDPVEVFKHFCKEEIAEIPDEHKLELFLSAIEECKEEKDI